MNCVLNMRHVCVCAISRAIFKFQFQFDDILLSFLGHACIIQHRNCYLWLFMQNIYNPWKCCHLQTTICGQKAASTPIANNNNIVIITRRTSTISHKGELHCAWCAVCTWWEYENVRFKWQNCSNSISNVGDDRTTAAILNGEITSSGVFRWEWMQHFKE